MRYIHFCACVAVVAAAESVLILGGLLTPMSYYSAGNTAFSILMAAIFILMGWSLSGAGFKKAAVKGATAAVVAMAIVSLAAVAGYLTNRPVIGMPITSVYYLPIVLLSISLTNILIFAILTVLGAWLAKMMKPRKMSKKKK